MMIKNKTTWRRVKLGDVLEITSSKRIFMSEYKKSGVPFYRGKEIVEKYNGAKEISTPLYISEEKFFKIENRFGAPKKDDILLSSVGTLGVPYLIKSGEKFYFKDGNLTWFRNYSNDVSPKFIYYWLISRIGKSSILASSIGSSQQALTIDGLKKVEINLPKSVSEQKRITDILSALDDKIELNNKISKNLEQTAQAIFKEWFVNFKFPRLRQGFGGQAGHEKVKMVDSELGKIPEGWGVKKFSEIAHLNRGVSYSSKEISAKEGGLPMISLANFLRGGGFNSNGVKHYTGEYKDSHLVKPGQIVIAMTDLTSNREVIGHPARVPEDFSKALISLDVCSINTEDIYVEFLYSLMLRRSFSQLMAGSASGTNVSHLNKTSIEEYSLIIPNRDLLPKFNELIRPMFTQQINLSTENQKLAALRDLLLPKLMSGEIKIAK